MSYKRNQIEEAIGRIFHPDSEKQLLTRLKRLLELDRALGRKHRSQDPEKANFAFFSEDAPGTGADISFSEYEVFALLNGLRIMQHSWPQGFAVSIMRRVRPNLESEHARILRQPPDKLFDMEAIGQRPVRATSGSTIPIRCFLRWPRRTTQQPAPDPLCAAESRRSTVSGAMRGPRV
jgi:hypothetical protein